MALLLDSQRLNRLSQQQITLSDGFNVNQLMVAVDNPELAPEVRAQLLATLRKTNKVLSKNKRDVHSTEIARLLDLYRRTGQWQGKVEIKTMPPGSPI